MPTTHFQPQRNLSALSKLWSHIIIVEKAEIRIRDSSNDSLTQPRFRPLFFQLPALMIMTSKCLILSTLACTLTGSNYSAQCVKCGLCFLCVFNCVLHPYCSSTPLLQFEAQLQGVRLTVLASRYLFVSLHIHIHSQKTSSPYTYICTIHTQ